MAYVHACSPPVLVLLTTLGRAVVFCRPRWWAQHRRRAGRPSPQTCGCCRTDMATCPLSLHSRCVMGLSEVLGCSTPHPPMCGPGMLSAFCKPPLCAPHSHPAYNRSPQQSSSTHTCPHTPAPPPPRSTTDNYFKFLSQLAAQQHAPLATVAPAHTPC